MLFGVLEMPESMWKDDSPLDRAQRRSRYVQAAQRIRDQDEQLAAKDAEIAELRSRIESLIRVKMDGPVIADAGLMAGLTQKSIEAMQSNEAAAKALRERDEARECVTRLYQCLSALVKDAPKDEPERPDTYNTDDHAEWAIDWDLWHMAKTAHDALAATPEHLR